MRGLEGGGGEEAIGFGNQQVDAAVQAVGGDGILHQAPDPLDRVVLVSAVLRQPEEPEPGVLRPGEPGPDDLGVVGDDVIEGNDDVSGWVGCSQSVQELDELGGSLARADQMMKPTGARV